MHPLVNRILAARRAANERRLPLEGRVLTLRMETAIELIDYYMEGPGKYTAVRPAIEDMHVFGFRYRVDHERPEFTVEMA